VRGARTAESGRARPGRSSALLGAGARLSRHALQPDLSSEFPVAELPGALPALARSRAFGRSFQLLYLAAADADAGRYGGTVTRGQECGGSSLQDGPAGLRTLAGISEKVSP